MKSTQQMKYSVSIKKNRQTLLNSYFHLLIIMHNSKYFEYFAF